MILPLESLIKKENSAIPMGTISPFPVKVQLPQPLREAEPLLTEEKAGVVGAARADVRESARLRSTAQEIADYFQRRMILGLTLAL